MNVMQALTLLMLVATTSNMYWLWRTQEDLRRAEARLERQQLEDALKILRMVEVLTERVYLLEDLYLRQQQVSKT